MFNAEIWLPIVVFAVVYCAISFELMNKAVAALTGVMVLIISGLIHEEQAIRFIDMETILLLMGMMCIVAILKKSGFFSILVDRVARLTKGSPFKIMILFSGVTALVSAFLDNVTTVIIMVPMVIELAKGMGLKPKIYIIAQVFASNLGGTATLIGDPPNIIIGSKAGLTFNQFAMYLTFPVVLSFLAMIGYFWLTNRETFRPINDNLVKLFSVRFLIEKIEYDFLKIKTDKSLLRKSICCTILAIVLFVTATITGLTPGIIAISVALILFLISRIDVEEILKEVEWSTLLFFSGLFILVGTLEAKGVIEWIAQNIFLKIGNNPYVMVLVVLWVSGLASGIIDNIPFTITMIPIVKLMLETTPVPHNILWWALSLGACFGGNLTLIGASANIVTVALAKKNGCEINFFEYCKYTTIPTLMTLVICSFVLVFYLWIVL